MTTRSSRPGAIAAATAMAAALAPAGPSRRNTRTPELSREGPGRCMRSVREVRLDDGFRNLLADALIARHRAQIPAHPELMLMRETWDADGWARAEADQLLAHIRAVLEHHS